MEWKKGLMQIINKVKLNGNNKKFRDIIENPWRFYHSSPGAYNEASANNNGETKWQRELYKNETWWYDLELPIGQKYIAEQLGSLRVDLIGMKDARPIICELKYTSKAGQPFDAILQLLAYYCMIVHNADKLDLKDIHHTNARNRVFKWRNLTANPILMLRANHNYWNNWVKETPKNKAAKEIIKQCKEKGLEIQLFIDDKRL